MRELDHRLSRPIHSMHLGPLGYLLVVPAVMFGSYGIAVTILALGGLVGWRFAVVCIMAAITSLAITEPLKHVFDRARPDAPMGPRPLRLRSLVRNPAFPSGDSAQAASVAVLLVAVGPYDDWRRWLFAGLAPLCMFSRVYFGAHWVGDTVAGAAIGAAVGLVYAYWFGPWLA